jgi:tetratricopeptide (TPR) repeat protein
MVFRKRPACIVQNLYGLCMILIIAFNCESGQAKEPIYNYDPIYNYYDPSEKAQKDLRIVQKYHLGKAMNHLKEGRPTAAFSQFAFIVRYFPNYPEVLQHMVQIAAPRKNMRQQMEEYLIKAVKIYPEAYPTYVIYGDFLQKVGEMSRAIKQYNIALQYDPNFSEAHYHLGLAYFKLKEYQLANVHAHKAYILGYPLPGLREMLKKVGEWKPPANIKLNQVTTDQH